MLILLLKWIGLALGIMFVGWVVPGITISNFVTALIAAVVIALINVFIKPVLIFLTLPINILTLGLFILVINALLFMFVAYLVPGVQVEGFWSAFLGALLLSIIALGISWFG
ncbi:phage holin family protein [Spirochaetes bacterium]|uniref:Phage holin family protein n=1 Tax=Candidatus Scatousia excrementipullorum TaxID=2840936 RepID=A0A9D9DQN6_9BACT|nr:phage holin family protein [Candidatus Scatousia excrementipullorum]